MMSSLCAELPDTSHLSLAPSTAPWTGRRRSPHIGAECVSVLAPSRRSAPSPTPAGSGNRFGHRKGDQTVLSLNWMVDPDPSPCRVSHVFHLLFAPSSPAVCTGASLLYPAEGSTGFLKTGLRGVRRGAGGGGGGGCSDPPSPPPARVPADRAAQGGFPAHSHWFVPCPPAPPSGIRGRGAAPDGGLHARSHQPLRLQQGRRRVPRPRSPPGPHPSCPSPRCCPPPRPVLRFSSFEAKTQWVSSIGPLGCLAQRGPPFSNPLNLHVFHGPHMSLG